jgi:hypothetical protein
MFFPSLLLLFYPLEVFLPNLICMRELSHLDFSQASVRRRAPWSLQALWLDIIRAFFGGLLLREAWVVEHTKNWWVANFPLLASLVILLLAIIAQMHTRRSRERFFAPVTFLAGIWLALLPLPVALLAITAGGVCMAAFRSLSSFFFFGALACVVLGYAALHAGLWSILAMALGFVPYFLSLLCGRTLAVPVRVEVVQERRRKIAVKTAVRMNKVDEIKA